MQGVTGPERQSVLGLAGVLGREATHSSLRLRRGQALGEAGPHPTHSVQDGGVQVALKLLSTWGCQVQGAVVLSSEAGNSSEPELRP